MNQTPLTNMEGRWVHSTKEAFNALVKIGCKAITQNYIGRNVLSISNVNGVHKLFQEDTPCYMNKQAYYHKGHFYNHPYEEFTITEEKVPFPELEDIEEFTGPKWIIDIMRQSRYLLGPEMFEQYSFSNLKLAYENGVPVTWNLKEKISLREELIAKFIEDYCETSTCEENMSVDLNALINKVIEYEKEEQCKPST